jgi:hypothetical protein
MMRVHKNDDTMRGILAALALAMVGTALLVLFFRNTPPSNKELISAVLGALLIKLTDVYGYYFNSSAGSQRKDETIGTLATTAAAAQTALAPINPIPDVTLQPGQTATVAATPEAPDGKTTDVPLP